MKAISPKHFFSKLEKAQIVAAIQEVEKHTSGEICVHLARKTSNEIFQEAVHIFEKLKLTRLKERNGILIYLALQNHSFSILGDEGIHQKVAADFWEKLKLNLQAAFQKGQFVNGLIEIIRACGEELKKHFPVQTNNRDEWPNLS